MNLCKDTTWLRRKSVVGTLAATCDLPVQPGRSSADDPAQELAMSRTFLANRPGAQVGPASAASPRGRPSSPLIGAKPAVQELIRQVPAARGRQDRRSRPRPRRVQAGPVAHRWTTTAGTHHLPRNCRLFPRIHDVRRWPVLTNLRTRAWACTTGRSDRYEPGLHAPGATRQFSIPNLQNAVDQHTSSPYPSIVASPDGHRTSITASGARTGRRRVPPAIHRRPYTRIAVCVDGRIPVGARRVPVRSPAGHRWNTAANGTGRGRAVTGRRRPDDDPAGRRPEIRSRAKI